MRWLGTPERGHVFLAKKVATLSAVSPTARGYFLAALATAGLALAVALTTRNEPPKPETVDAGPKKIVLLEASTCASIAGEYEQAVEGARACERDEDCVVEDRTGFFATLDGCFRITSAKSSKTKADELGDRWLAGGCAHDYPSCEKKPTAFCRAHRCGEKPPEGIPETWKRVRVPDLLTMFIPGDMHRGEVQPEDSFAVLYEGGNRHVTIDVGEYSPDPTPDAHFAYAPWDKLLGTKEMTVSGRKTTLFTYRMEQSHTTVAQASLDDVVGPMWQLMIAGPDSRLFFEFDCPNENGCDEAPLVLSTLEILSEKLEGRYP